MRVGSSSVGPCKTVDVAHGAKLGLSRNGACKKRLRRIRREGLPVRWTACLQGMLEHAARTEQSCHCPHDAAVSSGVSDDCSQQCTAKHYSMVWASAPDARVIDIGMAAALHALCSLCGHVAADTRIVCAHSQLTQKAGSEVRTLQGSRPSASWDKGRARCDRRCGRERPRVPRVLRPGGARGGV